MLLCEAKTGFQIENLKGPPYLCWPHDMSRHKQIIHTPLQCRTAKRARAAGPAINDITEHTHARNARLPYVYTTAMLAVRFFVADVYPTAIYCGNIRTSKLSASPHSHHAL